MARATFHHRRAIYDDEYLVIENIKLQACVESDIVIFGLHSPRTDSLVISQWLVCKVVHLEEEPPIRFECI